MVFNIANVVDWRSIAINKQRKVVKDNLRENRKRVDYDYQVAIDYSCLYERYSCTYSKRNVNERLNIRRLTPQFPINNSSAFLFYTNSTARRASAMEDIRSSKI